MAIDLHIHQLDDLLSKGTGRAQVNSILALIEGNECLFDQLLHILLQNTEPESRKAAWVIDIYSEYHPEVVNEKLKTIFIRLIHDACHTAIHRHVLRILARAPLPDGGLGELIQVCFDFLLSSAEPVAVKVHAMELLYRISGQEPDLKRELFDTIEFRMEEELPGFKNRGSKILRKLYREMQK